MRRRNSSSKALAGAALATVLAAGYGTATLAVSASGATPMDTEPPAEPAPPAPDPAPPAAKPAPKTKPAPKPVSKPRSAPIHRTPVYRPPIRSVPEPTYTPPAPTRSTRPVHETKVVKHRPRPVRRTGPTLKPEPVDKPAPVRVHIATPTAAVQSTDDPARRTLIITGLAVSMFFFLIAAAVPATTVRFTAPGRVVMNHQTDLVLSGLATLLLTLMLFLVTGG